MPNAECRMPNGEGRRHLGQSGYAMAALLTMIAVMSILLSAALPVWRHEMQREKEAELVFRGEQYVHAIALFQRKFGGTYPPNVDVLVQQKFLRKKYLDPITGKEFRPRFAGQLAQQQPGAGRPSPGGLTPQPSDAQTSGFRSGVGGLIGVQSASDETSIRIYRGRTKYSQWEFVYAGATARPGAPGGAQRPGPIGPGGMRPGGPMGPGGTGPGPIRRPGGPGGTGTQQPPPSPRPFGPGGD